MKELPEGIILENQGPWGNRGGSGNGNGGGGSGNNQGGNHQDPDLDLVLKQAQDRFKNAFGNKPRPNDFDPSKGVYFLAGVLFVLWLGSGFYRVQAGENAVVLTLGKYTSTQEQSGLSYTLPWPIQEVVKVNVAQERSIQIGRPDTQSSDLDSESMMLTGDENIIDVNFNVFWRIGDAKKYLFEIRDPDSTVKKVAESAMREIISRTEIQKALTESRGATEDATKALMQKILDDYQSGVIINGVQLQNARPPGQVVDAFDDVQRARTDKERLKNEAETYRNDIVPRARGDAQKLLQDAEAYQQAVTSKANGEADRFMAVYKAYAEAKEVTRDRIYIETMENILQKSKKVVVGDGKTAGVMPYLPLDQLKSSKGN